MRAVAAVIQMPCEPMATAANLHRADGLLRHARDAGAELAVLPEMYNTGYGLLPDYMPGAETVDGPTLRQLRQRSREWGMGIAAGFVEREGRDLYDSLAFVMPDGATHVYRKRHLVFWERSRFRPGRRPLVVTTPWGRLGFAVCADMIFRKVWQNYRDRIDLAVVAAAWPDFACRLSGRKHWLLGHVGPLSAQIPALVAKDLGVPVLFANQCGETRTAVPFLGDRIMDRFAGGSSVTDGRHGPPTRAGLDEEVVLAAVTIHPHRGLRAWRSTSVSAPAARSSVSAPC